jgi:type IV pilus assembly protein PilX
MSIKTRLPRRSLGLALPVVLIFLVVIGTLATLGVRRALVSEALTRNQFEFEVARQAAEAALRDAENDVFRVTMGTVLCTRDWAQGQYKLIATADCAQGFCNTATDFRTSDFATSANPHAWWPAANGGLWVDDPTNKPSVAGGVGTNCAFTGGVPFGTFTGAGAYPGVAKQPEYIIEFMNFNYQFGDRSVIMRVTARGFGSGGTNTGAGTTEVVVQSFIRTTDLTAK